MAIPPGDIGIEETRKIVALAKSPEEFKKHLLTMLAQKGGNGKSRFQVLLDKLISIQDQISEDLIEPIIDVIFDIGDELSDFVDRPFSFEFSTGLLLIIFCKKLLGRIKEKERRIELIAKSFTSGGATALQAEAILCLRDDVGHSTQIFSKEDVEPLGKIVCQKISRAIESKILHKAMLLILT